jgi:hypothetical protein
MKQTLSLFAVLLALNAVGASAADPSSVSEPLPLREVSAPPAIPDVDPLALYGSEVVYDVYRKGRKIGEHHVTFVRSAVSDLNVRVQLNLSVDVLFIKGAYTFSYSSEEIWRDKEVVSMAAIVNDNGRLTNTSITQENGGFKVIGSRQSYLTDSWLIPTSHWNRAQVDSVMLLNTLNNRLASVKIENKGFEKVETANGTVDAEHFHYTGDLRDIDTWYDRSGRWVKMRFKARDGSYIEYMCRKCGLSA